MGNKSASQKMIERVETCICEKFTKPELVTPSRVERRSRPTIDHAQAEAALEAISPHPGKEGVWKICDGKHDLVRSSLDRREWWFACNFSPMTHATKYLEEKVLEDFGVSIPPFSQVSKILDLIISK